MYFTEYLQEISFEIKKENLFLEQDDYNADQEVQDGPPPDPFEGIKKFHLYEKIKELRQKLDSSGVDQSDPEVEKLYEFIELVILFYNSLMYNEAVILFNNFLDKLADIINIKLPDTTAQVQQQDIQPPVVQQAPPSNQPVEQQVSQSVDSQQQQQQQQQNDGQSPQPNQQSQQSNDPRVNPRKPRKKRTLIQSRNVLQPNSQEQLVSQQVG